MTLDFIVNSNTRDKKFSNDLITAVKKVNEGVVTSERIIQLTSVIELGRTSVIFLENDEQIVKFLDKMKIQSDYKRYNLFNHIFVIENKYSDLSYLQKYVWNTFAQRKILGLIQHFHILIENSTTRDLNLLALRRLTEQDCQAKIEVINTFSFKYQKWMKTLNTNSNFYDLHDCHLNIRILSSERGGEREDQKVDLNFNSIILFTDYMLYISSQKYYFTYSVCDNDAEADLFIAFKYIMNEEMYYMNFYTVYTDEQTLILSTGKPYSSFEKLILPFDEMTWIIFLIYCKTGLIFILIIKKIINRKTKTVQTFLFGHQVESPAFNMVIGFFGQSQNILPRRNFARFLLMVYILFCLIIRTGYQGIQFQLMCTV